MSSISFNCDVCGREVFGCNIVNGMRFCAKCYQETFGNTNKDQQIAELKQQLAEKDEEIEILKKALELACKDKLPPDEDVTIKFCDTGFQTSSYEELIEYYEQQAEKEMK